MTWKSDSSGGLFKLNVIKIARRKLGGVRSIALCRLGGFEFYIRFYYFFTNLNIKSIN